MQLILKTEDKQSLIFGSWGKLSDGQLVKLVTSLNTKLTLEVSVIQLFWE